MPTTTTGTDTSYRSLAREQDRRRANGEHVTICDIAEERAQADYEEKHVTAETESIDTTQAEIDRLQAQLDAEKEARTAVLQHRRILERDIARANARKERAAGFIACICTPDAQREYLFTHLTEQGSPFSQPSQFQDLFAAIAMTEVVQREAPAIIARLDAEIAAAKGALVAHDLKHGIEPAGAALA